MKKEIIHTDNAPTALGPYVQAAKANGSVVFISGQLGLDPATGELVSGEFEDQVKQAFTNLLNVIKASGAAPENIVKLGLFVTDLGNFSIANTVMSELIPQPFPARSTIEVSALPKGGLFEVDAMVVV